MVDPAPSSICAEVETLYAYAGHRGRIDMKERPGHEGFAFRSLHFVRDLGQRAFYADFRLHADDGVNRSGHTQVGDIARSLWKNPLVGGRYVGMGAGDHARPAVQVPGQGFLLLGGFGVKIDYDKGPGMLTSRLGDQFVGSPERTVDGIEPFPSLQVDHHPFEGPAFYVEKPFARKAGGIVGRPQQGLLPPGVPSHPFVPRHGYPW